MRLRAGLRLPENASFLPIPPIKQQIYHTLVSTGCRLFPFFLITIYEAKPYQGNAGTWSAKNRQTTLKTDKVSGDLSASHQMRPLSRSATAVGALAPRQLNASDRNDRWLMSINSPLKTFVSHKRSIRTMAIYTA